MSQTSSHSMEDTFQTRVLNVIIFNLRVTSVAFPFDLFSDCDAITSTKEVDLASTEVFKNNSHLSSP